MVAVNDLASERRSGDDRIGRWRGRWRGRVRAEERVDVGFVARACAAEGGRYWEADRGVIVVG